MRNYTKSALSIATLLILLALGASTSLGQATRLTGVVFDPTGAVVPAADIKATDKAGKSYLAKSDADGLFLLELRPGAYVINVSRTGFVALTIEEYLVVSSTVGKMSYDIVLFGSRNHEPCGYSGADCLNGKETAVEKITITQSPKLKAIKY